MQHGTIEFLLNGESRVAAAGTTLGRVLADMGLSSLAGMACERNGQILAPSVASDVVLQPGDDILLVRMVGGG